MTEQSPQREALIIAALAGELDTDGLRDFDGACALDPSLLQDFRELQHLTERLDRAELEWDEAELPPGLLDRVLAATGQDDRENRSADDDGASVADAIPLRGFSPRRQRRRAPRVLVGAAAAASLLVIGALGGSVITDLVDAPPSGPPGTLGAVEDISFSSSPDGTLFDAALVAHTWGTETFLEVDGLDVGRSFEVVLVREDGTEYVSGAFIGSEQTITCQMNAAVMREDVSQLQIRDDSGAVVATSEVENI
jgi:hypothetical protein